MTPEALKALIENKEETRDVVLSVLNIMQELNIDRISCEYRGSGDSTDDCTLSVFKYNGEKPTKTHDGEEIILQDWVEDEEAAKRIAPYEEIINDYVFEVSFEHWGGWYNDEGGHGTAEFKIKGVAEPSFTIEHYHWETNDVHAGQYDYSATKDGEEH